MSSERKFAVTDSLAVPVDIITGIKIREGKMVVYTERDPHEQSSHVIKDSTLARRFIDSLSDSTNIFGARADDMERQIEEVME